MRFMVMLGFLDAYLLKFLENALCDQVYGQPIHNYPMVSV